MALALFIPVVLALAESVAIQSVTLALQGLHRPKLSWRRLWMGLRVELSTGVLLSLGCGLSVGLIVLAGAPDDLTGMAAEYIGNRSPASDQRPLTRLRELY